MCHRKWNYLSRNSIPHNPPLPLIGNMAMPLFRQKALAVHLDLIYNLNRTAKYVGFYEFTTPMIMIRDKNLIKSMLIKNFDHFTDHFGLASPEIDPLFGKMLFSIHGDPWRQLRSHLSPLFTASKIKGIHNLITDYAKTFVGHVSALCSKEPCIIDTKNIFTRFTNDVTATAIFGIALDSMAEPDNKFYILGKRATAVDGLASIKYVLMRSFPRLTGFLGIKIVSKEAREFFYNIVRDTVKLRTERGITRPDMIQLMMQVNSTTSDHSQPISIEMMTSLAFGFYFGGLDTTSTAQAFIAHMIAINSDVYKKLESEIDDVMDSSEGALTYEAINKMSYLDAVIQETMRIFPPVSFLDRICTKQFELPPSCPSDKPLRINPGTCIWIPTYSIQRDPEHWDNPEIFDPERFIDNRKCNVNSAIFLPFGSGPRMCTGYKFAIIECKILFCYLLYHCKLRVSPKTRLPLQLGTDTILMAAEGGFWLRLESRNKPDIIPTGSRTT